MESGECLIWYVLVIQQMQMGTTKIFKQEFQHIRVSILINKKISGSLISQLPVHAGKHVPLHSSSWTLLSSVLCVGLSVPFHQMASLIERCLRNPLLKLCAFRILRDTIWTEVKTSRGAGLIRCGYPGSVGWRQCFMDKGRHVCACTYGHVQMSECERVCSGASRSGCIPHVDGRLP